VTPLLDSLLLSMIIFLPLVVAAVLVALPITSARAIRMVTLGGLSLNLAAALLAWSRFIPGADAGEFQLEARVRWLDDVGASYHVGVDGLALLLVVLTALLGPLAVLASWNSVTERVKGFHVAVLALETAMLGAVCSVDVLLFYVFFEALLVPMYFLIGVWGAERRQAAATRYLTISLAGSVLMLVALLVAWALAAPSGERSFDYSTLYNGLMALNREVAECTAAGSCATASQAAIAWARWGPLLFLAFALAFAVKAPLFPLHTWLPDAYVQAPVAGSTLLAVKLGVFGFWRYAVPLFPLVARQYQLPLTLLASAGVIFGAVACLTQTDVKKLIAYASVSHVGTAMLGVLAFTCEGASGGAYQLVNHGVSTAALFLLVGFLGERRGTRGLDDFGGLAQAMPVFETFFVIVTLANLSLPGTNGFVGEFLVLLGVFKSGLPLAFGFLATTGVVLLAAALLRMVQKVIFGALRHSENLNLRDLSGREVALVLPLVGLIVGMGFFPQSFLDALTPATDRFTARAQYASGNKDPGPEDDEVRVVVRQLSPPGALAGSPAKSTQTAARP